MWPYIERLFAIEKAKAELDAEVEAEKLLASLQASGPRMPKPRAPRPAAEPATADAASDSTANHDGTAATAAVAALSIQPCAEPHMQATAEAESQEMEEQGED